MMKKALNECFPFISEKRKAREKMKVVYSFDRRRLIDEENNILAMLTKEAYYI